jgi:hypothetical protein
MKCGRRVTRPRARRRPARRPDQRTAPARSRCGGRTRSVIAIAPDGLGTPLERLHQAAALLSGRTLAMLLAPIATPVAATGAGRSLFFAMERGRPWQVPAEDAHRLLLDFAQAPGYLETVQAAMVDVPTRLERISLMIRSLSPRAC